MASQGDDESDSRGFSFRLPAFELPDFFPPDFDLRLPVPGARPGRRVDARTVFAVCVAFDVLDAVLALAVTAPPVAGARTLGGLLLAASATHSLGLAYGWELLAVALGYPPLTAFPTLTALLVIRASR